MSVFVAVDRMRPCTSAELLAFHYTQTKITDAQTQQSFIDKRAPTRQLLIHRKLPMEGDEDADERDDEMSEPTRIIRTEKRKEIQTDETAKESRSPLPVADSLHASSVRFDWSSRLVSHSSRFREWALE